MILKAISSLNIIQQYDEHTHVCNWIENINKQKQQ